VGCLRNSSFGFSKGGKKSVCGENGHYYKAIRKRLIRFDMIGGSRDYGDRVPLGEGKKRKKKKILQKTRMWERKR